MKIRTVSEEQRQQKVIKELLDLLLNDPSFEEDIKMLLEYARIK